ncbi:hypothetical protein EDD22DRAFT_954307 [Suillus occidentalis]|nr:hypothetical protein EDD22DRAFT_954307 [Suillus occidentalis]
MSSMIYLRVKRLPLHTDIITILRQSYFPVMAQIKHLQMVEVQGEERSSYLTTPAPTFATPLVGHPSLYVSVVAACRVRRARMRSNIQSVLIVTKARDNRLIKFTRELALYLMLKHRQGSRGLVVAFNLNYNFNLIDGSCLGNASSFPPSTARPTPTTSTPGTSSDTEANANSTVQDDRYSRTRRVGSSDPNLKAECSHSVQIACVSFFPPCGSWQVQGYRSGCCHAFVNWFHPWMQPLLPPAPLSSVATSIATSLSQPVFPPPVQAVLLPSQTAVFTASLTHIICWLIWLGAGYP